MKGPGTDHGRFATRAEECHLPDTSGRHLPPQTNILAKNFGVFGNIIVMARLRSVAGPLSVCILIFVSLTSWSGCGGGSDSSGGGGGGGGGNPPGIPSGLAATAGNQQVSLTWNAVTTASSYNVKRATTSGGPYTKVATVSTTNDTDTGLTNGTTYYYVVSAANVNGEGGNSGQASAMAAGTTSIAATVDVLANRHVISPYVYGGSYPESAAKITDSGLSVVRWGGNATSTYNWQLKTYNADADWYFEDFDAGGLGDNTDGDSTQFITNVKNAGSRPLMTMAMLDWVAKTKEDGVNGHWSFSVGKYGSQCGVDQYNNDAGNGLKSDCTTPLIADPNDAYFPLLDDHSQSCSVSSNCVYRSDWAAAMATAFGSGTCAIPYSTITSCHFYDMDNEVDIWGGTHRDIHPDPAGFDELANVYVKQAANLKAWDPQAVRLGPVSCCWWFYWNGADGNDKGNHAGIDFLPWWLNEVYWKDQISGERTLDMFDIHAYPDGPDMSNYTPAQKQALAVSIYRDYWDPIYTSPSGTINQIYTTQIQPNHAIPFRIPRMRAIVNSVYPGTPLAITEWSAEFAGAADFSTALGDADAYGAFGRERVSLATRWTAPNSANPNYQALKLFTNYDGSHHGFGSTSVAAAHNADAGLFSIYAALNSAGNGMTIVVLNKDPGNMAQVTFSANGFTPSNFTAYTLSQGTPGAITAGSSQTWSATQTFAPYTATLLVVSGTQSNVPAAEWDLNPDTIMVPAGGTVALDPVVTSGSGTITLTNAVFDSYQGTAACAGGSIVLTNAVVKSTENSILTVNAGNTPGFCHFTVTGTDGTVTQTQGGWIVVGNPPATFTKAGDGQTRTAGSQVALSVTLNAGSSGGAKNGASVYFTTDGGTLSAPIVVTDSNGKASVMLTLPASAGAVHVRAEGPFGLGHPVATFTETAQ